MTLDSNNTHTTAAETRQTLESADAQAVVTRLVIAITLLLIFSMAARTPLDTDMWWHLRAGDETLRIGQPLLTDPFSYTRLGAHWINHSWLSQVGMALLFRIGGYLALSLAVAGLAVLSMGLMLFQCDGPVFLRAGALLLGSVVASVVWAPRPQITSLVMLALVSCVLFLYKWRGRNYLWTLPIIFILWSNLHGGYVLGLLLAGAMLAGEALNHLLGIDGAQVLSWRRILQLALWTAACGLAVLLNPNGLDTWLIPFQTVNVGALQRFIPEWASPDFHNLLEQTLLWLALAVFSASALSGRRMDGTDLITFSGFLVLAMVAKRNYGPFALLAVPLLTRYATWALEAWRSRSPELFKRLRPRTKPVKASAAVRVLKRVINLSLIGLLALVGLAKLYGVSQPALVDHYLQESYPTQAVSWLAQTRPEGRLLSEYNWGGYLQWALPQYPVFVDGRTDLFGDAVIGDWITIVEGGPGWQSLLDHYQVDLVMLAPDRTLLQHLPEAGWALIYQDAQAVIYERRK